MSRCSQSECVWAGHHDHGDREEQRLLGRAGDLLLDPVRRNLHRLDEQDPESRIGVHWQPRLARMQRLNRFAADAELLGERLGCPLGVVAGSVEPPIHRAPDTPEIAAEMKAEGHMPSKLDVNAKTVPMNTEFVPSVAELPICQKTLQLWPPLTIRAVAQISSARA